MSLVLLYFSVRGNKGCERESDGFNYHNLTLSHEEPVFKSISRTVTCTGELSVLISIIPRGKDFISPRLNYSI